MKIKKITCNQFAGVRDRDVSFTDGINIIYGKNESGKSTLVNLISRTLFQNAKLDHRNHKDFFERYFPAGKKGSAMVGDFVDGTIVLETDEGSYKLSKEWGADNRCMLSTPDGVIRDQDTINEILANILQYGEGVYTNLLLSSQYNTDQALQTILDTSDKNEDKQKITDGVSKAFAESDGISMDAIEKAIEEKILEFEGKHWDFDRDAPVRKSTRWSKEKGQILDAYYAWEDAKEALKTVSDLEIRVKDATDAYATDDSAARAAEEAYNRFNNFYGRLALQDAQKKSILRLEAELEKMERVLADWPQREEKLQKAKQLQAERDNRAILDAWNLVQKIRAEISDEDIALVKLPCPESGEIAKAGKLLREITLLENKLCGMNLNAAIKMFGDNNVQIISLRTSEKVDISDGVAAITEAVKVIIPGVMEMQLSPADVDVSKVEADIAERKAAVEEIFAVYKVESLEELENYTQKITSAKTKLDNVNTKIARVLGSATEEQLEELYRHVDPATGEMAEIQQNIQALCGLEDLATFIAKTGAVLEGYGADYNRIDALEAKVSDHHQELEKAKATISDFADIPTEYLCIADPITHLESLKKDVEYKRSLRESAFSLKTRAISELESFQNTNPDACAESVEKAERKFQEVKSQMNHWRHIREVFLAQKETVHDNPLEDLARSFAEYLNIISGGRVTSEFPEGDKLNMQIYSDRSILDYAKLSEGTKETVSLAFRLAVLDHLFPEGGGVIVLDDPFTDMDAERTAQSCQLLKKCAERHQVIFLTCREDYLPLLEGNKILF